MKTFEERYTAWIDGELNGDDLLRFEEELEQRGESLPGQEKMQMLGDLLREDAARHVLRNEDFFNHQLRQRLMSEEKKEEKREEKTSLFPMWRLALTGAFSILLALGLCFSTVQPQKRPSEAEYIAQVLNANAPDPAISVTSFHSEKNNVTVLWLDGLEYLPDTYAIR